MSGNKNQEMITISSIASPGPQIVTIDSDSNEPTILYGFGRKLPIIPPSLNNLNLLPNPFNILATIAVKNPTAEGHGDKLQSTITGVFGTVADIDAPDEPQHN